MTTEHHHVAFDSWFMANSHWSKPELPGSWQSSLSLGISELSNWMARTTCWFE